jgi:hypothetical protein
MPQSPDRPEVHSMFLIDRSDPRARALEAWRDAEQLVSTRWDAFLEAEPQTRGWAYASYVAALAAEEAAATELASLALYVAA